MKNRYNCLLNWLKRDPKGQSRIDKLYEPYAKELKKRKRTSFL